MRVALVVPIDPDLQGNGLAHRARFWQSTLEPLGELMTIVIPMSGPALDATPSPPPNTTLEAERLVIPPEQLDHDWHPALAQLAPEYLGARWTTELPVFDLIVGLRAYVGPFCIGLRGATSARIVLDLDDDDASYHESIGDNLESERYARLVDHVGSRLDLVVSATGFDATAPVPNSVVVPPARNREPGELPRQLEPPRIVMVGNFGYYPNVEGATWFAEQVLPLVHRKFPDAVFVSVGPQSDALFEHGAGFIDDLHDLYASACLTVVPIRTGSGSRIKALESWAYGVPLVGTTLGLHGLDADAAQCAIIADTPSAFAEGVISLLADQSLAFEMGARGRDHVERRFGQQAVADETRRLIRSIVEGSLLPTILPVSSLDVEELDDGLAVYEPTLDVAHHLNPTAAIVFSLVDEGPTNADELASSVGELFGLAVAPTQEIESLLDELVEKRLVRREPAPGTR